MFTAFCCLLSTGCVRLPLKTPVRQPPELPQSLSAQLVHSQNEPQFVFAVFDENNRSLAYDIFQVGLESYVPHEGTNKVLTLECHIPRDAKNCPVIVLLPISAGSKYELERKFIAPYFAERGFAVILVFREDMRNVSDKAAIDILLRQSVLDEKRVLDWIETRSEFDSKRIASLGTSMGAIKNALLVAKDSRALSGTPKISLRMSRQTKYSSFSAHATASSRFGQVSRSERIWEGRRRTFL